MKLKNIYITPKNIPLERSHHFENPFIRNPHTPKPSAAVRPQLRPLASIVVNDIYPPQRNPRVRSQSFGNPGPSVRNAHLHSKKPIRNPPHTPKPSAAVRPQLQPSASTREVSLLETLTHPFKMLTSIMGNNITKLSNIPSHNHGSLYSVTFIFLWHATLRYIKIGDQS